MYNKLKELNITNRVVNEDNDYLLQEEYDKVLELKKAYSNLAYVMDNFNKYCKKKMDKYDSKSFIIVPKEIRMTTPEAYNTSTNNCVVFEMTVYSRDYGYIEGRFSVSEEGFKLSYIEQLYLNLIKLYDKNMVKRDRRIGYEAFQFKKEHIVFMMEHMKDINMLSEYFKDKVVNVEEDEKLLQELQEIDDFLENL